jgi:putative tricarboxylic transport membrane protein
LYGIRLWVRGAGRSDDLLYRPISATLLAIAVLLFVLAVLPMIRSWRDEVFVEGET